MKKRYIITLLILLQVILTYTAMQNSYDVYTENLRTSAILELMGLAVIDISLVISYLLEKYEESKRKRLVKTIRKNIKAMK